MDDRTGANAREADAQGRVQSGAEIGNLPPLDLYFFIKALDLDVLNSAQLHVRRQIN